MIRDGSFYWNGEKGEDCDYGQTCPVLTDMEGSFVRGFNP